MLLPDVQFLIYHFVFKSVFCNISTSQRVQYGVVLCFCSDNLFTYPGRFLAHVSCVVKKVTVDSGSKCSFLICCRDVDIKRIIILPPPTPVWDLWLLLDLKLWKIKCIVVYIFKIYYLKWDLLKSYNPIHLHKIWLKSKACSFLGFITFASRFPLGILEILPMSSTSLTTETINQEPCGLDLQALKLVTQW